MENLGLTVNHFKAEAASARREDFDAVMKLVAAEPVQASDQLVKHAGW